MLQAREVAEALALGFARAQPAWELEVVPIADGGPGTLDAVLCARRGDLRVARVEDPLGRPVEARWALLDDGTAVVEMAEASGAWRLRPEERDPLRASTFGTGQLIRAALDAGVQRIFVGAGGSATNDGGAGALEALGARLFDERDQPLPRSGGALQKLARIDLERLPRAAVQVLTDVRNPLLGPQGATRIFGPQKGATTAEVQEQLEAGLARFADVLQAATGRDLRANEGAGAAGGLAFGLAAGLGAQLCSGFEVLAELLGLQERVATAALIVTGEGRLDAQTGFGKGPARLAAMARARRRRVVCFCGVAVGDARAIYDDVIEVAPTAPPPTRAAAAERLTSAAERWARAQ